MSHDVGLAVLEALDLTRDKRHPDRVRKTENKGVEVVLKASLQFSPGTEGSSARRAAGVSQECSRNFQRRLKRSSLLGQSSVTVNVQQVVKQSLLVFTPCGVGSGLEECVLSVDEPCSIP